MAFSATEAMMSNTPDSRTRLKRLLITAILGALSPCVVCGLYSLQFESLPPLQATLDVNVLEFLAVLAIGILPGAVASIAGSRNPGRPLTGSPNEILMLGALQGLTGICLMLYVGARQPAGLAALGLQPHGRLLTSLIASGLTFTVIVVVGFLYVRLIGINGTVDSSRPDVRVALLYRTWPQRLAYLVVMLLGILAEELVYRGYGVLLLSARTGTPFLWAIGSVAFSIIAHLYQGRPRIPLHIIVATVLVGVTLATGNLVSAIGTHVLWNLMVTLRQWDWADIQVSQPTAAGDPNVDED